MVREILVWVLCLPLLGACGPPPASTGAPAQDDSLAARLTARIMALEPRAKVERHAPNHLRVTIDTTSDIYLDNLERSCSVPPPSCSERIETFARMVVSPPYEPASLAAVLATLKSQAYLDEFAQEARAHAKVPNLVTFSVVDDLHMVLVVDTPGATRMLHERDLKALGVTREELRERALANLRRRSPRFQVSEAAPQLYALAANDAYDSAMFLLVPEWQSLIERIGGTPVVVPIGRDIVLFAAESSPTGLSTLSKIVAVERRKPAAAYPITTQAYRWTAQGWTRFQLPSPQ